MTSTIVPGIHIDGDASPEAETRLNFQRAEDDINAIARTAIVALSSAQVLALNATPISVLAAPAAGTAHRILAVEAYKPAGTGYAGIAAGEDIALRYTNGSGATLATIEATGFLDQATAQSRFGAVVATDITPVAAAAVVAHMTTGEITTGDSTIYLRITYRIVPTTFTA